MFWPCFFIKFTSPWTALLFKSTGGHFHRGKPNPSEDGHITTRRCTGPEGTERSEGQIRVGWNSRELKSDQLNVIPHVFSFKTRGNRGVFWGKNGLFWFKKKVPRKKSKPKTFSKSREVFGGIEWGGLMAHSYILIGLRQVSDGWTNPLWKICDRQNGESSPNFRGDNKKLWNHAVIVTWSHGTLCRKVGSMFDLGSNYTITPA